MRLLSLTTLVVASLTSSGTAQAKGKILFFDLESQPAAQVVAQRINASLRSWVNSSDGLSSVYGKSLAETRRLHCKSAKLKRSFYACLARIGVRQKADRLVIGSVLPDGAAFRVVLTIVDTSSPSKAVTITELLSAANAQGPALESWIRKWFNRLFQAAPGYLIVSCTIDGIALKVDRKPRGQCGTGVTRFKLSTGVHRVTFSRTGYTTQVHRIKVRGGETTRLKVALQPAVVPRAKIALPAAGPAGVTPVVPKSKHRDRRTLWRALFFTSLGTGVALLVGSIFTTLRVRALENEKENIIRLSLLGPSPEWIDDTENVCENHNNNAELIDVCNEGVRMSLLTRIFFGVGAGLVATSAVFMYFAYFVKSKRRERSSSGAAATSIRVAPQVWKGGGGMTATLKF